ncbi:hypothetical protein PCE1_004304 [Barthelona sp. PCE]
MDDKIRTVKELLPHCTLLINQSFKAQPTKLNLDQNFDPNELDFSEYERKMSAYKLSHEESEEIEKRIIKPPKPFPKFMHQRSESFDYKDMLKEARKSLDSLNHLSKITETKLIDSFLNTAKIGKNRQSYFEFLHERYSDFEENMFDSLFPQWDQVLANDTGKKQDAASHASIVSKITELIQKQDEDNGSSGKDDRPKSIGTSVNVNVSIGDPIHDMYSDIIAEEPLQSAKSANFIPESMDIAPPKRKKKDTRVRRKNESVEVYLKRRAEEVKKVDPLEEVDRYYEESLHVIKGISNWVLKKYYDMITSFREEMMQRFERFQTIIKKRNIDMLEVVYQCTLFDATEMLFTALRDAFMIRLHPFHKGTKPLGHIQNEFEDDYQRHVRQIKERRRRPSQRRMSLARRMSMDHDFSGQEDNTYSTNEDRPSNQIARPVSPMMADLEFFPESFQQGSISVWRKFRLELNEGDASLAKRHTFYMNLLKYFKQRSLSDVHPAEGRLAEVLREYCRGRGIINPQVLEPLAFQCTAEDIIEPNVVTFIKLVGSLLGEAESRVESIINGLYSENELKQARRSKMMKMMEQRSRPVTPVSNNENYEELFDVLDNIDMEAIPIATTQPPKRRTSHLSMQSFGVSTSEQSDYKRADRISRLSSTHESQLMFKAIENVRVRSR